MTLPPFDLTRAPQFFQAIPGFRWRWDAHGLAVVPDHGPPDDYGLFVMQLPDLLHTAPVDLLPPPAVLPWRQGENWCWHGLTTGVVPLDAVPALVAALRQPCTYPLTYRTAPDEYGYYHEWMLTPSGLRLRYGPLGDITSPNVDYVDAGAICAIAHALPRQLWSPPATFPCTDAEGFEWTYEHGVLRCSDPDITEVLLPDITAFAAALCSPPPTSPSPTPP